MSQQRAAEIHETLFNKAKGHPYAKEMGQRKDAFLVQFERRFQDRNFDLDDIENIPFDEDIFTQFGLKLVHGKLPRQDDLTVLTKHLGQHGFLIHLNNSNNFRLSTLGYQAAINAKNSAEAL